MKQTDYEQIDLHMQSLLLCCCSPFKSAIQNLIKALKFKMRLEVVGHQNPGYSLFVAMAKRLGVGLQEVSITNKDMQKLIVWMSDQSTPHLRAWVPDMVNRGGDFHILCPFFFLYHTKELRNHDPEFKTPKVDNLYLLALWQKCFGAQRVPISVKILKDLLARQGTEVFTAQKYSSLVHDEMGAARDKAMGLSELAQLYLGFMRGSDGWKLAKAKDVLDHPFNTDMRMRLDAMALSGSSMTPPPVFIHQYIYTLRQIGIVTKNSWALNHYKLAEEVRAKQCLVQRLLQHSEQEIQEELGFSGQEEYYEWQVGAFLDVAPGRTGDVHAAWLEACEYFDLEPTKGLLDCIVDTADFETLSNYQPKSATPPPAESQDPEENFRAEPDYRSVVSTAGEQISLTPKQAEVIKMLHEALLSGTIDVSQARIINEVYPNAKTNSLKKLFSNKDVWDTLVEPGKRRGLYRLRVSQPRNS